MDFYTSIADNYDFIFPLSMSQVNFVKKHFSEPLSECKLLDIGCGTGSLSLELAKSFGEVCGIDLDSKMIQKAKDKLYKAALPVTFQEGNMLVLDNLFTQNQFDGVLCFGNTLVHLNSLDEVAIFFAQAYRVVKPGGKLFIQVINYNRILDKGIQALATIENDHVQFVRNYHYLEPQHKIKFNTRLTIKATGQQIDNEQLLLPVRQEELIKLASDIGFKVINCYGNFKGEALQEDSVPFLLSLIKQE